jgi:hypothetical protein
VEYDPYKYISFAVNAGDQVYRLTSEIQNLLGKSGKVGRLQELPPILAFQTVVDATVSFRAVVEGLFAKIPAGGHEQVLFDINRLEGAAEIFKDDPKPYLDSLLDKVDLPYTLNLVTNRDGASGAVHILRKEAGTAEYHAVPIDTDWPQGVHSLSHVALPFPGYDPLYGQNRSTENPGVHLGNVALLGEKSVLRVPASALLRLRWNPFYPYIEQRIFDFVRLGKP